jgi:hypothetical protein
MRTDLFPAHHPTLVFTYWVRHRHGILLFPFISWNQAANPPSSVPALPPTPLKPCDDNWYMKYWSVGIFILSEKTMEFPYRKNSLTYCKPYFILLWLTGRRVQETDITRASVCLCVHQNKPSYFYSPLPVLPARLLENNWQSEHRRTVAGQNSTAQRYTYSWLLQPAVAKWYQ